MNLLIIGATGRTGQQVVSQALERGHNVTALVRRTTSLQPLERLEVMAGDPRNIDDVMRALPGHDVVISCLGQVGPNDPRLVSEAASTMVSAMKRDHTKRYVIVSGGLLFPSFNPVVLFLRMILAKKLADARAMEEVVSASNVDWTVVRPPHLKDGDDRKGYQTRVGGAPSKGMSGLLFADLAACLLDAAESGKYVRQIVGVTSK